MTHFVSRKVNEKEYLCNNPWIRKWICTIPQAASVCWVLLHSSLWWKLLLDIVWILHILVTIIWYSDHQGWSHSRKSLATFPNPTFSIVFTFSLSRLGVNSFLWLALSTPRGIVTMTCLAMRVSCSVVTSTLYSFVTNSKIWPNIEYQKYLVL